MYASSARIGVLTNAEDWIVVQRTGVGPTDIDISVTHVPGVKANGKSNVLDILLAMCLSV